MLRIKKDDQVIIVAGKDKGKTGKVLRVIPATQKAVVETLNLVKKSQRKSQKNQQGGFIDMEAPIHISNLMLIDKKDNRATRFGTSILKDGSRVRIAKKSGEVV